MGVGIVPMLLSLIFPACGHVAAAGVRLPGPVDFVRLQLPHLPNKALVARVGFSPNPDSFTPPSRMSPKVLCAIGVSVAGAEPRPYRLDSFPGSYQAAWVARTPGANFPDVVEAAVDPDPVGGSDLILYPHSIHGFSDFGTNAARVRCRPSAIAAKIAEACS